MKQLLTAGLLVIKNNKLLLTYSSNKEAWYLAGGKLDADENSKEALIREINEELSINLNPEKLVFYTHVSAKAYGEDNFIMEQDCFLYDLDEEIKPNNEIEDIKYFSFEEYLKEEIQVEGVLKIFKELKNDKLLD